MRVLALAALIMLAALTVPAAEAQFPTVPTSVELSVDAFPSALPPGRSDVGGEVRYTVGTGAPASGSTRVTIEVAEAPGWAVVTVDPASVDFEVPPEPASAMGARTFAAPFRLTVVVAEGAPAHQPVAIKLHASATENAPHAASEGETEVELEAAYVPGFEAELLVDEVRLPDRWDEPPVAAPIRVRNLANGVTKVSFEMPVHAAGLQAIAPIPLTLESAATGGTATEGTANAQFAAELRNPLTAPVEITVRVTAAYALDASQAAPGPVFLTIRVLPPENPQSAPDPRDVPLPALAGIIALAAAAFRNRTVAPFKRSVQQR